MMLRGTRDDPPAKYQAIPPPHSGARQNAYTSGDPTNKRTTFAKQDLETVLKVEADRFQHLSYGEDAFKTESRAVPGEYNKNSANPQSKLYEGSPLYKRLAQDGQKVDPLDDDTPGRVDPTLATIGARVKKIDDAVYVRDAIPRTVAQPGSSPAGERTLADAKSALKYGLVRSLDNTGQIAATQPRIHHQLLFSAGSAHDPVGKEGLAALTAAMAGSAGASERGIDELAKALFPMAGSFSERVDKEMSPFTAGSSSRARGGRHRPGRPGLRRVGTA
jgi:hypothetical protein